MQGHSSRWEQSCLKFAWKPCYPTHSLSPSLWIWALTQDGIEPWSNVTNPNGRGPHHLEKSCPTLNQIQHFFQANGAWLAQKHENAEVQFWLNLSVLHSPSQKSCKFLLFKLLGYPQSVHQTPHWIQHPTVPPGDPPKTSTMASTERPTSPGHTTGMWYAYMTGWYWYGSNVKNIYVVHAWTSWVDLEKQNCPRTRVQWQVGEGFGSGFCKHKHVMSFIRGEHPSFFLEVLVKHYHCNSPRLYVKFRWIFLNMLGWFCFSKWNPLF